jgi:uncharacterized membrane protein
MRIIEVIADPGHLDTLLSIAEQHKVADAWFNTPAEGERGVLALASGAAAVLSQITGLSSALVGVMVAVALLPHAATLGMMLGSGNLSAAIGAALLLAVNIVCINLSAKLMFLFKGVRPRTWLEKSRARQSVTIYTTFWILSLLILIAAIILRHGFYS